MQITIKYNEKSQNDKEMRQKITLAHKEIKTVSLIAFHMFKNLEKISVLSNERR